MDFHRIGLVEVLWKMVMVIQFHNNLHDFCNGRGTDTTSLEAKLLQKLTELREEVLCEILLDTNKAYDDLDRGCYLENITEYNVSPRELRLLWRYWYCLMMLVRAGR